jgi:hypothetical protein
MVGVPRHGKPYYLCRPSTNNRGRPDKYGDHPKALYLRGDAILDAASRFFADRVFGAERLTILESESAAHERIEKALGWQGDSPKHGGAWGATSRRRPDIAGHGRTHKIGP